MLNLLFKTDKQATTYAKVNELEIDKKQVNVGLTGFEGQDGAPDHFYGESMAFVARDNGGNVIGYLAYWESEF